MLSPVYADLETQSGVDIKSAGAAAYIADKTTRLLSAVFLIDDYIVVWVPRSRLPELVKDVALPAITGYNVVAHFGEDPPPGVTDAIAGKRIFVAHNADNFDAPAWARLVGGVQPEWYDTIHACRASGLPAGLDRASRALGGQGKDARGSRAMKMLTHVKAGNNPVGTTPLWNNLIRYNIVDVLELKRIHELTEPPDADLLRLHRKINAAGIPVDTALAGHLSVLWEQLGTDAKCRVAEMTGGELSGNDLASPSKIKKYLARKGCIIGSLARAELERMIADPESVFSGVDDETSALLFQVLRARQDSVRTAPGKLERIKTAAVDGRVKDCFIFHGAHTGRWSARELQPHNFPRGLPSLDMDALLARWADGTLTLDVVAEYAKRAGGSTADALASLLRPVIRASEGSALAICDYASVEARCVAWLARDEAMLQAFSSGRDIYCEMASAIFGRKITKADKLERQVGKNTVLGCGYQMGANRFTVSAELQGCNLSAAGVTGDECVKAFRRGFPSVPAMWGGFNNAFRRCIGCDARIISSRCVFTGDGTNVYIRLPSGRKLHYRDVRFEMLTPPWGGEERETPTYASPRGMRRSVFGGSLTENISQATCRDLLASAMLELDRRGHKIVMHVHDEIVVECDDATRTLADMLDVMTSPPEWACGFPLAAEGFVSRHYVKNPPAHATNRGGQR